MGQIKKILMDRDKMSANDADALIEEAKEAFECYIDESDLLSAYEVCQEFFGLEPDYIMELMP